VLKAAEGLNAVDYLIVRAWRVTGEPLYDIRHRWTVGDLFMALQGIEIEQAIEKAQQPKGKKAVI